MNYLELELQFENQEFSEILIAELSEIGFSSFSGDENILKAYIQATEFEEQKLEECFFLNKYRNKIKIQKRWIKAENWNRKWEENFEPVVIEDKIYVRAPFHPTQPEIPIEILIMPKMAFGTGHHATTYLMLKQILELDLKDKKVADLGCGSGILAIAASKLGAKSVSAVDIDEWSYKNTTENVEVNRVKNIVIKQGTAADLEEKFDVVLANINRNVLVAEMNLYQNLVAEKGILLMSGFYVNDKSIIEKSATREGFRYVKEMERDNWLSVLFKKN